MHSRIRCLGLTLAVLPFAVEPVFAHHVMDGAMPVTFTDGLLSGLGHPVIGLDHLAAVVAVGVLAAAHRSAAALALSFIAAMMAGVALHLYGAPVPAAEIWVALSVIALGALMLGRTQMPAAAALALFAVTGLFHGYALGESIVGAEPAPLYAYLTGLAVMQGAIALAAMNAARFAARREAGPVLVRLAGAGIACIGLVILSLQVTANT